MGNISDDGMRTQGLVEQTASFHSFSVRDTPIFKRTHGPVQTRTKDKGIWFHPALGCHSVSRRDLYRPEVRDWGNQRATAYHAVGGNIRENTEPQRQEGLEVERSSETRVKLLFAASLDSQWGDWASLLRKLGLLLGPCGAAAGEDDVVLGSLGLKGQLQFSPWPLRDHTTSSGVGKKLMRRAGELHSKQWEALILHAKVGDSWDQSDGFNNRGAAVQNCGI